LGAREFEAELEIDLDVPSTRSSLLKRDRDRDPGNYKMEKVKIRPLSAFCSDNGICHINYLKIDTEGYDLEVLKGASELLAGHSIDLLEVEVGMNPRNDYHVNISVVLEYLESKGYLVFGVYEQVQEWVTSKPFLRRSNVLFISGTRADKEVLSHV
jgi:hypothetical protein